MARAWLPSRKSTLHQIGRARLGLVRPRAVFQDDMRHRAVFGDRAVLHGKRELRIMKEELRSKKPEIKGLGEFAAVPKFFRCRGVACGVPFGCQKTQPRQQKAWNTQHGRKKGGAATRAIKLPARGVGAEPSSSRAVWARVNIIKIQHKQWVSVVNLIIRVASTRHHRPDFTLRVSWRYCILRV